MNGTSSYSAWLGEWYATCVVDECGTVFASYAGSNALLRDIDEDMDESDEWLDAFDALRDWVSELTGVPADYVDRHGQDDRLDPCIQFELEHAHRWIYEKDMEEWR